MFNYKILKKIFKFKNKKIYLQKNVLVLRDKDFRRRIQRGVGEGVGGGVGLSTPQPWLRAANFTRKGEFRGHEKVNLRAIIRRPRQAHAPQRAPPRRRRLRRGSRGAAAPVGPHGAPLTREEPPFLTKKLFGGKFANSKKIRF